MASTNISKDLPTYEAIISRVRYLVARMVYNANHRDDKVKGDPKVGGHAAASTSPIHILAALHLIVKSGFDHMANKPHASPGDHSFNYLLDLFLNPDLSHMTLKQCNTAMDGLRHFSKNGDPVFQSYHASSDPDNHNFFPAGSVGIPAVMAGYLAHAFRYAKAHGYNTPDNPHFWCIIGDSEFREGSLLEAAPEFAERECGNLTWIIDYNRQSLDGHRITNESIMNGTDDLRIARTMEANGWEVIQLRHGQKRLEYFTRGGGKEFQNWLENELSDFELQAILRIEELEEIRTYLNKNHSVTTSFLKNISDDELYEIFYDLGGHDLELIVDALNKSKKDRKRPTMIIAHTIKGWGLDMAVNAANHNILPGKEEILALQQDEGIAKHTPFARFEKSSAEAQLLEKRSQQIYKEILAQRTLKEKNQALFKKKFADYKNDFSSLDINLKMASYPHTQWMLGQLTSKLSRIADTPLDEKKLVDKQRALKESEKPWKVPGQLMVSMAPDVGTSTNQNPSMDGKIYYPNIEDDFEKTLDVKDLKNPDLVPHENETSRYLRFDITEANTMSCMGSYGKMNDLLGIPLIPVMTIYDFFIKRALDQYFYDLYWNSSFILFGTPAGVTLSPEGAQHSWKSDIQIPNQITWEPFFCQELDWIFSDALGRHFTQNNKGRTGVLIRCVTRGIEQKDLLKLLKTQRQYKVDQQAKLHHSDFLMSGASNQTDVPALAHQEILDQLQQQVLSGAYYLLNYQGYQGYEPGDNVVNIFALGSLTTEAVKASNMLLKKGIYANVVVVTSQDLLLGTLGRKDNYDYLKNGLGINSNLHLTPTSDQSALNQSELAVLSGRRVPIVSVHDGEPGMLDNIGSIIGVRQEALAVHKHSKCGTPKDIYEFHGIDADSVVEACGKVLSETALEQVSISKNVNLDNINTPQPSGAWKQLWT